MNIENSEIYSAVSGFIREHSHEVWEIAVIMEGGGTMFTEDGAEGFSAGTVFAVPPGAAHSKSADGPFKAAYLYIRGFLPDSAPMLRFMDDGAKTAETLITLIHNMKVCPARTMAAEALRCFVLDNISKAPQNRDISAAADCLRRNFKDPEFKAADALKSAPYNQEYFCRVFSAALGRSPTEYLLNLRLNHAASLLIRRGLFHLSVAEVAENSGFYDANYFARAFKKKFGVPPKEYGDRENAEHI